MWKKKEEKGKESSRTPEGQIIKTHLLFTPLIKH